MNPNTDTITAIATPLGNGGVGIIRLSGDLVPTIAAQLLHKILIPRIATYSAFFDADNSIIDNGIALYFPAPHSYTGEPILELQAHGGMILMDVLLRRVIVLGARLARAGEFSERAFLNNKLDLVQAEAIADLITSSTEQAVRSAQKSMQGVFSAKINELVDELIELRCYVEASIDFVDEDIDFLSDGIVETRLLKLIETINTIHQTAQQGRLLHDGMTVVLAGKPNVGKSSLLNALAGHDAAIVTDIAGTTRDILRERIQLDGMPLHIIDTAGLHESDNVVEQEGIRRARLEIAKADKILLLVDVREPNNDVLLATLPTDSTITTIYNKIDLINELPRLEQHADGTAIYVSVKTGAGLDLLRQHLKQSVGFNNQLDNIFIARRRHLDALTNAQHYVQNAVTLIRQQAGELVAEECRHAQNSLAEITGQVSSDDLLGKIFSSFCIGK